MTARALVAIGVAGCALGLSACGGGGETKTDGRQVARYEPGPCPPTPQPIEQALKANHARCGVLVVPENRSKDNGRTIRLAVATVPAKSPKPAADPLVFFAGGPGVTAWTQIKGAVKVGFNRQRNVIFMGQRGTRLNTPYLGCPEVKQFNLRAVDLRSYAPSTRQLFTQAIRKCRERLGRSGVDASAYNTTENAADFEDLRTVLKLGKWNVYAGSYGTDLALIYMRNHPDGIRSVTLDSLVPPDAASLSWTWTNVGEGVKNLLRACAAQQRCARRYPHLEATFNRLVRDLEARPAITRVKHEGGGSAKVLVDGGALVNWITEATTNEPDEVPAIIDATAHGHPTALAMARLEAADADEAKGMQNSILCSEWVPYESFSQIAEQGRLEFPSFPNSVLAQAPGLPFLADGGCRAWDVPKAPAAIRAPVHSAIPTLVLGGSFDALTGQRWARHVAGQLKNATLVPVPGVGHGALLRDPCPQRVFASFLSNPNAPNTSCVSRIAPASAAPFTISKRAG